MRVAWRQPNDDLYSDNVFSADWVADLKTRHPLILTARIDEKDLAPFDALRQKHFPPDRNFLRAHLTMFHRLPGEYVDRIVETLQSAVRGRSTIVAQVSGVRHLGAGVAFDIDCAELIVVRDALRGHFIHWLGSQDMQRWKPHITVQNKASRAAADMLYRELTDDFQHRDIKIIGIDLWRYLDGPWANEASVQFAS